MADTELLTVKEVAGRLKLNPQTVRRWIKRGLLPAARVGGKEWRIRESDLEAAFSRPSAAELRRRRAAVRQLLEIRKRWAASGLSVAEIMAESRAELEQRGAPGRR
jgi:excisionase family DNA binding protein